MITLFILVLSFIHKLSFRQVKSVLFCKASASLTSFGTSISHPVKSGLDRGEKFLRLIKEFSDTLTRVQIEAATRSGLQHRHQRLQMGLNAYRGCSSCIRRHQPSNQGVPF